MNTRCAVIGRDRFSYSTDFSFTTFLVPCKELGIQLRTRQKKAFVLLELRYQMPSHQMSVVLGFLLSLHVTAYSGANATVGKVLSRSPWSQSLMHQFPRLVSTSSAQGVFWGSRFPAPSFAHWIRDSGVSAFTGRCQLTWWGPRPGDHSSSYQGEEDNTGLRLCTLQQDRNQAGPMSRIKKNEKNLLTVLLSVLVSLRGISWLFN